MSYVVHIWEEPSPATWAEAQAVFQRLVDRSAPRNPRFAELARRIQAAWPDLADEWTLDAPDGAVDEAVWSLGLERGLPETFYPRLIDAALALGLTVHDEQTGECFVPGPWRLSQAARQPLAWPTAPAQAPALLDVQGRARALLLPPLAPHGFELETPPSRGRMVRTVLRRSTPLGRQCIEIAWTGDAASHHDATMVCSMEPILPGPVAKICGAQSIIDLKILDTPQLNGFLYGFVPAQPTSREYRASGRARLDALLSALADWLLQELLPVLDRCKTLEGFLANEQGEPRHPISVKPYLANLALAHCAGVPDLDGHFDKLMERRRQARLNPGQMDQAYEGLRTQAGEFFGCFKEASA
ncbi:MAG: hypothetical protein V4627_04420 [Pseudomonadota bacterium]